MSTKPVGISDIYATDAAAWPFYSDLKPRWLRTEFHWYAIEPSQGSYNWSSYDLIVQRAQAAGIKLLAILNHPPAWAQTADFNTNVQSIATQLRTRYGTSVDAWEVFNEPNTPGYGWPFQDGGGAAQAPRYAAAVNAFAAGYRPATGTIVIGAVSLANDPGGFTAAVMQAVPIANFDAFSVHPYGYATIMPSIAANVKTLMTETYGSTKPVWFSEMGNDNDATTAQVMQQTFAQVPNVDALFWFSLRDLQAIGWNFGVMEYSWAKKQPVYNNLKAYLAAA